jgi:hypothetical protein
MAQTRIQLFDGDIFDEAVFDVDTWAWTGSDTGDTAQGQMLRGRRNRRKLVDYEHPILKNVRS